MGKKVNDCNGDRMYQICESVINDDRDIEYFNDNIKDRDFSAWFRLAVKSSNFRIADLVIDLGYDVCEDEWVNDDIVNYMNDECKEQIEYLFTNGLVIDYKLMDRIEYAFTTLDYLHTDDEILNDFRLIYRSQQVRRLKRKCQVNKSF